MKILILSITFLMMANYANAKESVRGYSRNDSTFVAPYSRSNRDNSYNNNYSTRPNINTYTGDTGRRAPTWDNKAPSRQVGNRGSGRSRRR